MSTHHRSSLRNVGTTALLGILLLLTACKSSTSPTTTTTTTTACTTQDGTYFTLTGTATYDWIPALDSDETLTYPKLSYASTQARPIRRATVQAINSLGGILSEALTDDDGNYSINVPGGCGGAKIRIVAKAKTSLYTRASGSSAKCNGANWDVRIVDNTRSKALWAMETSDYYNSQTSNISVHASTTYASSAYQKRTGAPFALLDTIVTEMEPICGANPSQSFPLLYINWSPNNDTSSGLGYPYTDGHIGTSFFTIDTTGISNIFILGKENSDTDEYDDHVIAHEYGHYLEYNLFRADSIGGHHSFGDVLDLRVAFSEGYGNAISGMTFDDPIYVDTSGFYQQGGFDMDVSAAPTGNDRGIYSETSVQYLLYNLYENRKSTNPTGPFDRIYSVLKNYHSSAPAFTTALTFAAHYNADYEGSSESLQTLWSTGLNTPYDALCSGACNGSGDTADLFDTDNDVGIAYDTANRSYASSTAWTSEFWQVYRSLSLGTNSSTGHEQIAWSSAETAYNKFGNSRWYQFTAPASTVTTVWVSNVTGIGSCTVDALDAYAYHNGVRIARNELPSDAGGDTSQYGCPKLTFNTTAGQTYIIEVRGYEEVDTDPKATGWTMIVTQ